jgi:hypothetical protein
MSYEFKTIKIPKLLKNTIENLKENEKEPIWRVIDRAIAESNYNKHKENKIKAINFHLNEIKGILGVE